MRKARWSVYAKAAHFDHTEQRARKVGAHSDTGAGKLFYAFLHAHVRVHKSSAYACARACVCVCVASLTCDSRERRLHEALLLRSASCQLNVKLYLCEGTTLGDLCVGQAHRCTKYISMVRPLTVCAPHSEQLHDTF